jgi:hypothetical protein
MMRANVFARPLIMDADRARAQRIIDKDTSRDLANLKARARRATVKRGHRLGPWTRRDRVARAVCRECQAWVRIDADPHADAIDLGGPALAQPCRGK